MDVSQGLIAVGIVGVAFFVGRTIWLALKNPDTWRRVSEGQAKKQAKRDARRNQK